GAGGVADRVILDDPALAPVGADQPRLLGRGRRPGGGRVAHRETANGEEIDAGPAGIKDRAADVDFHLLLIGIDPLELRPDRSAGLVHLREPQRRAPDGLEHVIEPGRLREPLAVEIDSAGVMLAAPGIEPVTMDEIVERIEAAEEG